MDETEASHPEKMGFVATVTLLIHSFNSFEFTICCCYFILDNLVRLIQ